MKVTVYPTTKNALNIRHPADGVLRESGSEWTNDGFTARMLTDGEVTKDKSKAYSSAPQAAAKPAEKSEVAHTPAPSKK